MNKLELSKDIRLRKREISEQMQTIVDQIQKQYSLETTLLRQERDSLSKQELDFVDKVAQLFRKVKVGTKIKVTTQVGPNGGEILNTYTGEVTKIYDNHKPCFDMSDPNRLEGKPFTIGSSCIQSFEVLP